MMYGYMPGPPQPNPPLKAEEETPHEHLYICDNCEVMGKAIEPFICWLCGEPCKSTVAICEVCNQRKAVEKAQGGI